MVVLGCAASITLASLRPHFITQQNAAEIEEPMVGNRWVNFDVPYSDNSYFNVNIKAEEPLTFEIVRENGEPVFRVTEAEFRQNDICLRLPKGRYWLSLSCEAGFDMSCELQ